MEPSARHIASLPARAHTLLARARREEGLGQIATLTVVSQMLREQLDAVDRRLSANFARDSGTTHRATDDALPLVESLAALVALAEQLDRDAPWGPAVVAPASLTPRRHVAAPR